MIALDTDVLAVYHVFHRDLRYETTTRFFEKIAGQTKAVAIFNLLELCGILACAKKHRTQKALFDSVIGAEDVVVLFPNIVTVDDKDFWATLVSECFARIQKGMRLGDAAILWTLETCGNNCTFITWNTRHFKEKTAINILTPSEFLLSVS